MLKRHSISKLLLAVAVAAGSTAVFAQQSLNTTATVTVQNAFNFNETTALGFGTLRVATDVAGTNVASIVVPADGSAPSASSTGANASATVLTAGTPAAYTIDSAAPFTNLTITFPTTDISLTAASAPPGSPDFVLQASSFNAQITSGPNNGSAYNTGTPNLQTDVTGAVSFNVGALIHTTSGAAAAAGVTSQYIDSAYTGSYQLTVAY